MSDTTAGLLDRLIKPILGNSLKHILVETLAEMLERINKFPGNAVGMLTALESRGDAHSPARACRAEARAPGGAAPARGAHRRPGPAAAALPLLAPGPSTDPARDPPAPRAAGTRGGAEAPRGGRAPGEGEGHEAEDGEAEEGDGVRAVEELQSDVLHLLLIDHAEVQAVIYVVLAQGPAPHARRHLALSPLVSARLWLRGAARPKPARPPAPRSAEDTERGSAAPAAPRGGARPPRPRGEGGREQRSAEGGRRGYIAPLKHAQRRRCCLLTPHPPPFPLEWSRRGRAGERGAHVGRAAPGRAGPCDAGEARVGPAAPGPGGTAPSHAGCTQAARSGRRRGERGEGGRRGPAQPPRPVESVWCRLYAEGPVPL